MAQRRTRSSGVKGVLPHVVAVVAVPLVKPHHGEELRPKHAEDLRIAPQNLRRAFPRQELEKLRLNPFRRDIRQPFPVPADGRRRPGLDFQAQRRRKAKAPENPQGVLLKPPVRVPHAAEASPAEVLPAPEGVPELSPEVPGHGVGSEVPPGQVLVQGTGKGDGLRAAVVPVGPVDPVGRDLHRALRRFDGDGAVPQPRGQSLGPEYPQGLLRLGGGSYIPVPRAPAQQGVPDTAAHAPRLMARRFQGFQYGLYILRNLHGFSPFRRCISLISIL